MKKVVYPHQYMDESKKFNETSLPKKESFYCYLNVADIKYSDCNHAKRVCKDFEIICILKLMHYYWLMFLNTSEKFVEEFMN